MKVLIVNPPHKYNFHLDLLNQQYTKFIEKLYKNGVKKVDIINLDAEFYGILENHKIRPWPKSQSKDNFFDKKPNFKIMLKYLGGHENKTLSNFLKKILPPKSKHYDYIIVTINWHRQILGGLVLARYLKTSKNKIIFGNIMRHSSFRAVNLEFIRNKFKFIDCLIEMGNQKRLFKFMKFKKTAAVRKHIPRRTHVGNRRFICFELAPGCINRCSFCSNPKIEKSSLGNLRKNLVRLKEISGKNNKILFMQPAINPTRKHLNSFLNYVKNNNLNISWTSYAICRNLDLPLLKKMRKAGCKLLEFGIESGSQRMLNYLQKGTDITKAQEILKNCHKAGIKTCVFVMISIPHETNQDFKKTIQFLVKNQDYIDYLDYDFFQIRYGSLMYKHPGKYGIKIHKNVPNNMLALAHNIEFAFDEIKGVTWPEKLRQRRTRAELMDKITKNFKGKIFPTASKPTSWEELFESKYLKCLNG